MSGARGQSVQGAARRLHGGVLAALGLIVVVTASGAQEAASARRPRRGFSWGSFAVGAVTSIAAHEASHVITSIVAGGSPGLHFDRGRPVISSGIESTVHPTRQFAFAASGMVTQFLLNELILDSPRDSGRAGEFERGVLAGGVGTVVFYFTLGRNAKVSDVQQMTQNSSLSKGTLTAIFGTAAAFDVIRILSRKRYAQFLAVPDRAGGLRLGVATQF